MADSADEKRRARRSEAHDDNDDVAPRVGQNLRRLRTERGLSLEALSKQSGVSRAMLSQVELGQSAPTINVLWKIAHALDLPFSALMSAAEPQSGTRVIPAQKTKRLTSLDGTFASRALFPGDDARRVEFYELTLKRGAKEEAEAHARGTRENLVVARGTIEIQLPDAAHHLLTGDAIVFDADVPHTYRNVGDVDAIMYLVMTYLEPRR